MTKLYSVKVSETINYFATFSEEELLDMGLKPELLNEPSPAEEIGQWLETRHSCDFRDVLIEATQDGLSDVEGATVSDIKEVS